MPKTKKSKIWAELVVATVVLIAVGIFLGSEIAANIDEDPLPPENQGEEPGPSEADSEGVGEIVKEFAAFADLDRDGSKESARVTDYSGEGYYQLEILDPAGETIWGAEAGVPHVGWLSIFYCPWEGKDFLLRYNPYMAQGMASYTYELFYLDAAGAEQVLDSSAVQFDVNFGSDRHNFNPDAIAAFLERVNAYLGHSELLLSTDDEFAGGFFQRHFPTWLNAEGFSFDAGQISKKSWQPTKNSAAVGSPVSLLNYFPGNCSFLGFLPFSGAGCSIIALVY